MKRAGALAIGALVVVAGLTQRGPAICPLPVRALLRTAVPTPPVSEAPVPLPSGPAAPRASAPGAVSLTAPDPSASPCRAEPVGAHAGDAPAPAPCVARGESPPATTGAPPPLRR